MYNRYFHNNIAHGLKRGLCYKRDIRSLFFQKYKARADVGMIQTSDLRHLAPESLLLFSRICGLFLFLEQVTDGIFNCLFCFLFSSVNIIALYSVFIA